MKKLILITSGILILLNLVNLTSALFYYEVNMNYHNRNLSINSVSVLFSNLNLTSNAFEDRDWYYLKIGEEKYYFNLNKDIYYDYYDNNSETMIRGGKEERNNFTFNIYIPYSDNKKIELYNSNGSIIGNKSVIEYSKTYSKEEYTQNNPGYLINNSYNNYSNNEDKKNNYIYYLVIALIIILVLLIIYYIFLNIKKKK